METIIDDFLNITIPDIKSGEYDLPYIKFVFSDDALDEMEKHNKKSTNYLRRVKKEYENKKYKDGDIYINVDDYHKFFYLLNEIVTTYRKLENTPLRRGISFIRSIWLRMSPSDIIDVNRFLEKQLTFLKNVNILPDYNKLYKEYEDIPVYLISIFNEDWFETNKNISFYFEREGEMLYDGIIIQRNYRYKLPSIHYELIKEDGEAVCYIYGIQSIREEKDEIIKEKIQPLRRELRNKYVSPDFVIALKIFLDYLCDKEIYTIKVPLLQVYNYTYHQFISNKLKKEYDQNHDSYNKFVDKEDIISKNKTERLVETFMVLSEKYDNIEFLNEPFIEGDYLLINIRKVKKKEI